MRDLSTNYLKGRFIVELMSKYNSALLWHPILEVGKELLCINGDCEKANLSFEQALQLADDLVIHRSGNAILIKASALICIGAAYLCMGKRDQAAEYFRRGERMFVDKNEKYGQAVAIFALALIYESSEDWRDVFKCYEQCQSLLTDTGPTQNPIKDLLDEVSERRGAAIREWRRKSIGDSGPGVGPAIPKPSPFPFEFLPIFSQIPAGDPRPIPKHVSGYVETDHIIIDGKYYMAKGKDQRIRLPFSTEFVYIVLKVDGDSMNNAGIDDGDYVILRTRPVGLNLTPEDGDIVAVALPSMMEEPFVTLKRYRKGLKGEYSFEPDSTNPNHKSYHFGAAVGIPPRIVGVLVAVLKPL